MLEVVEAIGEGAEVGGGKVYDPLFAHALMGISEKLGLYKESNAVMRFVRK